MKKVFCSFLFLIISPAIFSQEAIEIIPFKLVENLIFFEMQINDSPNLTFLFDTGAGITVVNEKTAAQLNLKVDDTSSINTAGRTLTSLTANDNTLKIGNAILKDVPLEIMYLEHLDQFFGFQIDCIIGYDLLERFVVRTDIDKEEILLYENLKYKYPGDGETLPIEILKYRRFTVPVAFQTPDKQQVERSFLVDTAFPKYLKLHNKTVRQFKLIEEDKKYKVSEGFSADSLVTQNYRSNLKAVAFARKKWNRIPVELEIDKVNVEASQKTKAYGIIGQAMLLDFNIVYDYKRKQMFLEVRR